MIGTFSLFIAFLLVLPPPLINGETLNQLRLRGVLGGTGQHRAQPRGGAVQEARHLGHLLHHQASNSPTPWPLQLYYAAKGVLNLLAYFFLWPLFIDFNSFLFYISPLMFIVQYKFGINVPELLLEIINPFHPLIINSTEQ